MPARAFTHPGPGDQASTRPQPDPTRWVPVACAVGLIGSLFLPWYSLTVSTTGAPLSLGLASTAPQWMTVTPWVVLLTALAVIVYATAGAGRLRVPEAVRGLRGELAVICPLIAVMLIVFRLVQPPTLPGSSLEYNLQGRPEAGPFIALALALAMTASVYAQARRRGAVERAGPRTRPAAR